MHTPARLPQVSAALVLALSTALAWADAPGSQAVPTIMVGAENGAQLRMDVKALAALPQRTVQAKAHGETVTCTGPTLIDVLGKVGVPHGNTLRGKALAMYARVSAADGYSAVFALAELDPDMQLAVPIVTASCDGKLLDAKTGPFRIIVPGDERPARWVRQVTAIDLLRAPAR